MTCFLLFCQADGFMHSPLLTHGPAWRDVPPCPTATCSLHSPPWRYQPPPTSSQGTWSSPSSVHQPNFHFSLLSDICYSVYPLTFLILFMIHVGSPLTFSLAFLTFSTVTDRLFFLFATREASQVASEWNRTEGQPHIWNRKLDYSLWIKLEIS